MLCSPTSFVTLGSGKTAAAGAECWECHCDRRGARQCGAFLHADPVRAEARERTLFVCYIRLEDSLADPTSALLSPSFAPASYVEAWASCSVSNRSQRCGL